MPVNKGVEALSHSEILDIADTLNSDEGPATRRAFSVKSFRIKYGSCKSFVFKYGGRFAV
jgi:hypothetical protein